MRISTIAALGLGGLLALGVGLVRGEEPADAGATAGATVTVPADLGLESLAPRAAAQRAEAASWTVDHAFSFTDRVEASGIAFRHEIVDDAGRHYKAVHYDHGNGVAAADVDGDGLADLYFTSQLGGNELWVNLGGGRFRNATEQAGVALAGRVSVAASFADADNDGDADLFVTTVRMGNVLFENDGTGRFRDVTAQAGLGYSGHSSGAVFFDYDRDGLLDLFVSNVGVYTGEEKGRGGYYVGLEDAFRGHLVPGRSEPSILYRNLGGLRFEDVSEKTLLVDHSWTGDAAAADLDGDGFQDLYVLDMQGPDNFWRNVKGRFFVDTTDTLFPRTPPGSMGIEIFDWNRDGRLDVLLTDMHSDMVEDIGPEREKLKSRIPFASPEKPGIAGNALFEATSDGNFREVSDEVGAETYWPWGVSVDDLNADGYEDAFVTASMNFPFRYGIDSVLLNEAGQRFRDAEFVLGVEPRAGGATVPWFEVDCGAGGAAAEDPLAAWQHLPAGEPGHAGHDAVGGDVCGGREGRVTVLAARGSRSSVILDLDGDGDLDVVTNEFNDRPQVLVSDLASRRSVHWLEVELVGRGSNRDGLGARVTVVTPGLRQLELADGKSGYLSQSRLPLYFGLGRAERVERVEVEWPSGARQVVEAPPIGRRLRIVEEAARTPVEGAGAPPASPDPRVE